MTPPSDPAPSLRRVRIKILPVLLAAVPAGFLCKVYTGPLAGWFRNYGAALFYEIFWVLFFFFLRPRPKRPWTIPAMVFCITAFLEFLQLWHPPFLEAVRRTFVGRTLIGTTFAWWDFPHYLIGCWLGWEIMKRLRKGESDRKENHGF